MEKCTVQLDSSGGVRTVDARALAHAAACVTVSVAHLSRED